MKKSWEEENNNRYQSNNNNQLPNNNVNYKPIFNIHNTNPFTSNFNNPCFIPIFYYNLFMNPFINNNQFSMLIILIN